MQYITRDLHVATRRRTISERCLPPPAHFSLLCPPPSLVCSTLFPPVPGESVVAMGSPTTTCCDGPALDCCCCTPLPHLHPPARSKGVARVGGPPGRAHKLSCCARGTGLCARAGRAARAAACAAASVTPNPHRPAHGLPLSLCCHPMRAICPQSHPAGDCIPPASTPMHIAYRPPASLPCLQPSHSLQPKHHARRHPALPGGRVSPAGPALCLCRPRAAFFLPLPPVALEPCLQCSPASTPWPPLQAPGGPRHGQA